MVYPCDTIALCVLPGLPYTTSAATLGLLVFAISFAENKKGDTQSFKGPCTAIQVLYMQLSIFLLKMQLLEISLKGNLGLTSKGERIL